MTPPVPSPSLSHRYRSQPAPFVHAAFPHHLDSPPDGLHLLPPHGHTVPASSQPAGPPERSRLAGLRPVQPAARTGKGPAPRHRHHPRRRGYPRGERGLPEHRHPEAGTRGVGGLRRRRTGGGLGAVVAAGCRHPVIGAGRLRTSVGVGSVRGWSRRTSFLRRWGCGPPGPAGLSRHLGLGTWGAAGCPAVDMTVSGEAPSWSAPGGALGPPCPGRLHRGW